MRLQTLAPPHPADVIEGITLDGCRVTLINMPIREQALPNNAPLGPALLAARLEALGAEVHIADLNVYRPVLSEDATRQLLETAFGVWGEQHLIGLSGLITTLGWQQKIAKMVKEIQPQALLISGGGLATQFREKLFKWVPELDGVAHSEGDDVIVKAAFDGQQLYTRGRSENLRPYIRDDGRFLYHGDRPRDLDEIPFPAWHLHDELETYIKNPIWGVGAKNSSAAPFSMERSLNTVSSRGCPFACKFCFRGAQGERNYGVHSAEYLASHMFRLSTDHDLDFVGLLDDNFMVQPKRLAELPDTVGRVGVRWGTHGRLDEAADAQRVEHMAEAGCVYIGFGAESASPKTLEAMGKGGQMLSRGVTTVVEGYPIAQTMMAGVVNAERAGIHDNCTWIMGYPGEALEDLKSTAAFIAFQKGWPAMKRANVNSHMFVATAYPGTEMFRDRRVQERLKLHTDKDLEEYVLKLDDASSVLWDDEGPVNFSAMDDDTFLACKQFADEGTPERILEL